MKIDKQNNGVAFNDEEHVYWNIESGVRYISVTTLIEKFGEDFDPEFWSKYKALEQLISEDCFKIEKKRLLDTRKFDKEYYLKTYDIDETKFNSVQQDILDKWHDENVKSCERGTTIHAKIEKEFLDSGVCELQKYGLGGKFNVRSGDVPLDEENGVYPEYLIHVDDGDLHLAGQIDLLIKNGNDIYLKDWKTNKKIETKGFYNPKTKSTKKMKYPLQDMDECNFSHYTLQLSIYAWMIQFRYPDLNIKGLQLVHFDHDGKRTAYDVEYKKSTVERLLRYWKSRAKVEERKQLREPIEF